MIRVAVLMGGKSSEYQVSITSGKQVVASLDKSKYEVLPVVISKDGSKWIAIDPWNLDQLESNLDIQPGEVMVSKNREVDGLKELKNMGMDVVFLAMHGEYGEDGKIQGMLELFGIPYTGSGVLTSALGMDKYRFGKILDTEGIVYPKSILLKTSDKLNKIVEMLNGFPLVVKPNDQGSSVGVKLVKNISELKKAVGEAKKISKNILVQEYIKGMEITCAVIGNENPLALPVVEIVPKNNFFDYESKYTSNDTKEIVPARISAKLTKKLQNIALKVYKTLGARGFSRIDFILKENNEPYCLEINTIPGLTEMSLLPKAAEAYGMNYSQLIEKIIYLALE